MKRMFMALALSALGIDPARPSVLFVGRITRQKGLTHLLDAALESHIGTWDAKLAVLAAGMITSRQGWIELPYVPCPAGPSEFARNLHHHVSKKGRKIAFATGLSFRDSTNRDQAVGFYANRNHFACGNMQ